MAEIDPERLKQIEAEERARAEIRARLEQEKHGKYNPKATWLVISLIVLGFALAWEFMLAAARIRQGMDSMASSVMFGERFVLYVGGWLALFVMAVLINSLTKK